MCAALVGVACDHGQGLVPRDPLDRRQVYTGLNKVGNNGVPKYVRCDLIGI